MSRPTVLPDWATAANYTAGTYAGQTTKSAPPAGNVAEGFNGGYGLPAEWLNYVLNNHAAWINYQEVAQWLFGFGTLSAAVFDGASAVVGCSRVGLTYTATQDLNYTSATFSAGVRLKMAGFRLYVRGLLDMSAAACFIDCNGNAGALAVAGAAPGALLAATGAGGAGGPAGNIGSAGTNVTSAIGANGAAGGNGAFAGGAGATATAITSANGSLFIPGSLNTGMVFGASGVNVVQGGAGGGGGGGGTGTGGGGGGGGGVLLVVARSINVAATSFFQVTGGAGAAGSAGINAGGGGGGGGGGIIVIYADLVSGSSAVAGQTTLTGGAGGAPTAGGAAGSTGSTGNSYVITLA